MRSVKLASAGISRIAGTGCLLALSVLATVHGATAQTAAPNHGLVGIPVQKVTVEPVLASAVTGAAQRTTIATAASQSAQPPEVDAVKGDTNHTRFVIGLEKPAEFQVFSLANPNRVIVELPDVRMQLPAQTGTAPVGLVKSFYGGLSAPGKMRVVIAVTSSVVVEKAAIEKNRDGKSHRLVIDIVPVDQTGRPQPRKTLKPGALSALGNAAAAPAATSTTWNPTIQPPLPKPAVRPDIKAQKSFKPVIVIDPGHGGHDSGATRNGAVEKDVVLAFSLQLRAKLNATGRYKVLMTRDNDSFVDLDARRAFAEQHNAALFIAVHADYAGAQARGATIYSLREGVAKDLKRSAKGEVSANVLSSAEMATLKQHSDAGAVKNILADLAEREVDVNKERTSIFARSVIEYMGGTTSLQNNPDRSAAFRVLKTAKVPAVLIELAYVTNRQDAANLQSNEWRDKVSASITTAIENYFSNQIARLPM